MEQADNANVINLIEMAQRLREKRKIFYWAIPITFVVSALLILCVPRYYRCSIVLAPESQSMGTAGALGSLASNFGFDLGTPSEDAIYPTLYPDVIKSTDFLTGLFDISITSSDGKDYGNYYTYLTKHQRYPFWTVALRKTKSLLTPGAFKKQGGNPNATGNELDVFWMNKRQWSAIGIMRNKISCAVDRRTNVISITVQDQDPFVCAAVADSIRVHLQAFMTDYHTQKARSDMEYYDGLLTKAHEDYLTASRNYISYVDSHSNLHLEQHKIQAKNLEDEMNLRQTAYTSFQKQYLTAQTKLQENTPIYTTIQSASVPERPAGPHRMIFVIGMCFFVSCIIAVWICRKELKLAF